MVEKAAGLYEKSDFIYDKKTDTYRCSADQVLTRRHRSFEAGMDGAHALSNENYCSSEYRDVFARIVLYFEARD